MASNIFASLTRGAKFKTGAHSKTRELFAAHSKAKAAGPKINLLDIVTPSSSSDKRKRQEEDDREDEVDDDDDDDDDDEEEEGGGNDEGMEEEAGGEGLDGSGYPRSFSTEEAINTFRNMMQIKAKGSRVPPPVTSFADMPVSAEVKGTILKNIEESDWKEPTAIQMQAIPALLAGRDVLAAAPTGSGKTAAYLIPALSAVCVGDAGGGRKKGAAPKIRALVLAPTRELADQIHREAVRLCAGRRLKIGLLRKNAARGAAAGGGDGGQLSFDLLVATPMRLLFLCREKAVDLSHLKLVILDEADRLFELSSGGRAQGEEGGGDDEDDEEQEEEVGRSSFLAQVDEILAQCPATLQRGLFSATLGPFVLELAGGFLRNPVHVMIGRENTGAASIEQRLIFSGSEEGKLVSMRQLIQQGIRPPVLLFVQSVERAKSLYRELVYDGIKVEAIHADKTQKQREDIIRQFRCGDIWVLICTDLMARGVDFKAVQMVINYDLPQTAVSYIHRIGRTGRAGRAGLAVTFFTEDDLPRLRGIANVMRQSGCDVPAWMLSLKALTTKQKRKLKYNAPERGRGVARHQPTSVDTKMARVKKSQKKARSSQQHQQHD